VDLVLVDLQETGVLMETGDLMVVKDRKVRKVVVLSVKEGLALRAVLDLLDL